MDNFVLINTFLFTIRTFKLKEEKVSKRERENEARTEEKSLKKSESKRKEHEEKGQKKTKRQRRERKEEEKVE